MRIFTLLIDFIKESVKTEENKTHIKDDLFQLQMQENETKNGTFELSARNSNRQTSSWQGIKIVGEESKEQTKKANIVSKELKDGSSYCSVSSLYSLLRENHFTELMRGKHSIKIKVSRDPFKGENFKIPQIDIKSQQRTVDRHVSPVRHRFDVASSVCSSV